MERLPDWWVNFADWSGVHTLPPPGKPFPTDIGKNPSLQGFCFPERTKVMPILLWLLGVPLLVVIALYLLHVI